MCERSIAERSGTLRILTAHFFRRFFDNDTVQPEGDTQTTVVRAVAIVSMPGLMTAFWMESRYPWMPMWTAIDVRCFFVVLSFVVMGVIAVFEWEMLFPDKLDFLVLTPLPIRPIEMFAAKTAALAIFLSLFLTAVNLFAPLILPGARGVGQPIRQMAALLLATVGAGVFAALVFLAIGGVMLCMLSARMFRVASPILQMLAVMAVLLLLFLYLRFAGSIPMLLQQDPLGAAQWLPPFWFLGLCEEILHGSAAPLFAAVMAGYAVRGLATMAAVVLITYPLAWARVRKMTIEGTTLGRGRRSRGFEWLTTRVVRRPGERAVFHFIGQTIARNNRYQVYLAMYCGTGLALAVACAVGLRTDRAGLHLALSTKDLHAVLPLLLFWIVAGLRAAFAFPLNLPAAWVFRIAGVTVREAAAARAWVLLCALAATAAILAALAIARWDPRHLLVQAVCGLCLSVLLTDGFFAFQQGVPFTRPRMPGRTSLPLMLTLYVGVLAPFIFGVIRLELALEKHPAKLLLLALAAAALHALTFLHSDSDDAEPEREEDQGEFQLLGLSG